MKLLIVDDQKNVVDGLQERVDWGEIGIKQVFGAYSAAQARVILAQYTIDVLLCDIEMPIEDGLSLIKWMRGQGMTSHCILLTSHAEFSYAQKSLSLGAFDYVVQPAPFAEIRAAVNRAVQDILSERELQFKSKYGQVTNWKRSNEAAKALERFLRRGGDVSQIETYSKQGLIPAADRDIYLVLLRIVSWSAYDNWTPDLLAMMVDNAVNEVFSPYRQFTLLVPVGEESFAFIMWSNEQVLAQEGVTHQLSFLFNVLHKQLKCTVAIYQEGPFQLAGLRETWKHLEKNLRDEPPAKLGVPVSVVKYETEQYNFCFEEIHGWPEKLQSQGVHIVRKEAALLLETLSRSGEMNPDRLEDLYRDFMKAIDLASGNGNEFWRYTLTDADSYNVYRNGMKSLEDFMALLELALGRFERRGTADERDIVERVTRYIENHLEEEIHRSDLAAYVYLNPDYLNRLFKKRTGYTLKEYIIRCKMNEAKCMLQMTRLPVNIIAAKVGYGNFSHFSYTFKKVTGQSPVEIRQQGETKTI